MHIEGDSVLETNIPRTCSLEVFVDGKKILEEAEDLRTYQPFPFARVTLPKGASHVMVRVQRRHGRDLKNIGDFVHYERNN